MKIKWADDKKRIMRYLRFEFPKEKDMIMFYKGSRIKIDYCKLKPIIDDFVENYDDLGKIIKHICIENTEAKNVMQDMVLARSTIYKKLDNAIKIIVEKIILNTEVQNG